MAQAAEVHVRAAQYGDQRSALGRLTLRIALHAGDGERSGRFHDRAHVLEDVLDGGANLVRVDEDDLVYDLARHAKSLLANAPHGDAVGERADALERDEPSRAQRVVHARRLVRLDADDLDARVAILQEGADAADQPAAADGDEYRIGHARPLALDLGADRALAGDDVGIVERMHEAKALGRFELTSVRVGVVVRHAVQHGLAAERDDGVDLDRGRRLRHHDDGPQSALAGRERDALRVIACRAANDAVRELRIRRLRDLVIRAAQLEREHGLQVLALQVHVAAEARR